MPQQPLNPPFELGGWLGQERKVPTIMRICKKAGLEVGISKTSTKETREFLGLLDASLAR